MQWQASASLTEIKRRAKVLATIRQFFGQRGVLEVETPLLCAHSVTDPHIAAIAVPLSLAVHRQPYYLQTSPEYAMKRLLASVETELDGGIYQLCKAFRHDACSPRHNPEFTLLEWYRPGFTLLDLIDEVAQLLVCVYAQFGHTLEVRTQTFQSLFELTLGLNPHVASRDQLLELAEPWLPTEHQNLDKKDLLDLLFSFAIEPGLREVPALFVTDYPACMAALATLQHDDVNSYAKANRFELYLNGIELANGYHELTDVAAHQQRFSADQQRRVDLALPDMAIDTRFLAALEKGLPACSGVALGVDRLLMALSNKPLGDVLTFAFERA